MHAIQQQTPFNPVLYSSAGSFRAMVQGLEETLRRWDEIDPLTALQLPAYLLEALEAEERHGVPLLRASSVAGSEVEFVAMTTAAADVMQRVEDDGYDVDAILLDLRAAMRPAIEAGLVGLARASGLDLVAGRPSTGAPGAPHPFYPTDFVLRGTTADLTRGLEESLRRYDELDVLTALWLSAYFLESRDLEMRHRYPLFSSPPASLERERLEVNRANQAVQERAHADGHDVSSIVRNLRLAMRPSIDATIAELKQRSALSRAPASR